MVRLVGGTTLLASLVALAATYRAARALNSNGEQSWIELFATMFGRVQCLKSAVRWPLVFVCAAASVTGSATKACGAHHGGWARPCQEAAAGRWQHPMCHSSGQSYASLSIPPADVPHATDFVEERLTVDGEWVRLAEGELSWSHDQLRYAPILPPEDMPRVRQVRMLKRPRGDASASWHEYARSAPGDIWAYGQTGVGRWQILMEVQFDGTTEPPSAASTVQDIAPARQQGCHPYGRSVAHFGLRECTAAEDSAPLLPMPWHR